MGKLIFGDTSKESLIELNQGQLYLVRPLSPKGYSELIFKDAAATIRRTNQEYQYQLVIQRAYEEGEAELLEDEDEDGSEAALSSEKDEKVFLLDEDIHFRSEIREGGDKVLAWRDLSGDVGDVYEFVCDDKIPASEVQTFEITAGHCQYERKYRKNYNTASQADLDQFSFADEPPIPTASPQHSPKPLSPVASMPSISQTPKSTANSAVKREHTPGRENRVVPHTLVKEQMATAAPAVRQQPSESLAILTKEHAELHLFDFQSGSFLLVDSETVATVSDIGRWNYWLEVKNKDKELHGQLIEVDINPVFNFEYLSFIFNAYTENGSAYSWLLRFKNQERLSRFQDGLMTALWQNSHQEKWENTKEAEKEYVLEAFQELTMEDAPDEEQEEEEVEDVSDGQLSEEYDSDEEEDDVKTKDDDGNVNSQLAVGYKHDRSFVVRGSKIGVFKHTPNNHLEFSTNISKVQTPGGKLFKPKKVMLHSEDTDLILQNEADPNSLYRMDLEYGRIVDEWKVHDDIPVSNFLPENKFAQMTSEQTFLGHSHNALFRIDPRLSGAKLVDSQLKQYASKNDFSAAATTEQGYIAVASTKGDTRLFDRLGINAKTHIPALGDPIIGMDVSADGNWILATCRTYLLLIDARQKEGKNEGKLGFEKPFGKDSKPQPRRLGLTPSHVAQFQHETGAPLSFTPAHFNTGKDVNEKSIVTATGPFIVTWDLKKVLRGAKDPYSIKRYAAEVKADNFKYGGDKNVIVALPNEVNMVDKKALKRPTRESITLLAGAASTPRRSSGRVGTRESARYKLGRDEVVNSPY